MRLRGMAGWALCGGLALAALEIAAILSGVGAPWLSLSDMAILLMWLGIPYAAALGCAGLAGFLVLPRLLRRCPPPAAYAGTVAALAALAWLRELTRLREAGSAYLALEALLALVAAGAGVTVGRLAARTPPAAAGPADGAGRFRGAGARRLAGAVLLVVLTVWAGLAAWDFAGLLRAPGPRAGAAARGAAALAAAAAGRPNIVLISIDTLRADHVGSYGYAGGTTPNIDALAAGGVRFAQASTTAAFTVPTHASMMTGLFPSSHGASYQHEDPHSFPIRGMSRAYPTLAEILGEQGYDTAAFVSCSLVGSPFGFDRGFATFDDRFDRLMTGRALALTRSLLFRGLERARIFGPSDYDAERRADEVTPLAVSWLRGRGAGAAPFFLFVHYYDPHAPYAPPPPFDRRPDGSTIPQSYEGRTLLKDEYTLTPAALADTLALYDGEIRFVDTHVGRLLGALKEAGALDNTLLILTSDHGESFGEHDHWAHTRVLYEDVVAVPFILRLPGGAAAGRVVTDVIAQPTDILPTVLDAARVKPPGHVEGRDLIRLLGEPAAGAPPAPPALAFAEQIRDLDSVRRYGKRYDRDLVTARTLRWKYIHASTGLEELYDLSRDAGETVNLAAGSPGDLAEMRRFLDLWRQALAAPRERPGEGPIDEGTREQLRSLGYVQ